MCMEGERGMAPVLGGGEEAELDVYGVEHSLATRILSYGLASIESGEVFTMRWRMVCVWRVKGGWPQSLGEERRRS